MKMFALFTATMDGSKFFGIHSSFDLAAKRSFEMLPQNSNLDMYIEIIQCPVDSDRKPPYWESKYGYKTWRRKLGEDKWMEMN